MAAALEFVQKAVLTRMIQFANIIERGHPIKSVCLLVIELVKCHFSNLPIRVFRRYANSAPLPIARLNTDA